MTSDRGPGTTGSDQRRATWLVPAAWFLAGVSVGGIIALTLMPGSPAPYRFIADLMEPWVGPGRVAWLLNVLLFVPPGLVLGFVGRLRLLWLAPVASVGIELLQWIIPQRNPDPWDVVANSAGAVGGYLIAATIRLALRRRAAGQPDRPEPTTASPPVHSND